MKQKPQQRSDQFRDQAARSLRQPLDRVPRKRDLFLSSSTMVLQGRRPVDAFLQLPARPTATATATIAAVAANGADPSSVDLEEVTRQRAERKQFTKDYRAITSFGAQFLDKRQRSAFDQQQQQRLLGGISKQPGTKMPLKMLQGLRKAKQRRLEAQRESRDASLLLTQSASISAASAKKGKKRRY